MNELVGKNHYSEFAFPGERPQYEVYALRYATSSKVGPITFYWRGGPNYKPSEPPPTTACYYFLIKGPNINILFDTGVVPETAKAHPIVENYEDHATMLSKLGLKLEDISVVITSHAHWDHVNGIRIFPNATHYIQETCYDWTVKIAPQYHMLRKFGYPLPEDIEWLVKLNYTGKLELIKGERAGDPVEILPGIYALRVDGHFMGCQGVIVNTAKGPVVLASDSVYLYGNFEMDWPPGICMTDLTDALDGMKRYREILKSGGFLIPGHDLAVMEKFPVIKPGVVRIA